MQIRLATEADAERAAAIYAPVVRDTPISFEFDPPSVDEMRRRIREGNAWAPWFVAEIDGVVVGYVYASRWRPRPAYQWTVETTAYVDSAYRGRGVGGRLYRVLIAALRWQGFRTAVGVVALPNPASVALHESVGFVHAGSIRNVGFKLGEWRTVGWWQLDLGAPAGPVSAPRPTADLLASPDWPAIVATP